MATIKASSILGRYFGEPGMRSSSGTMYESAISAEPGSFEERMNELFESYKDSHNINIRKDLMGMVSDAGFMKTYRDDVLHDIKAGFESTMCDDPNGQKHVRSMIENVETLWDAHMRGYNEAVSVSNFLPLYTLEFPVLTKQFFANIAKDIIEVEATKTPMIRKHIMTRYMIDSQTGDAYEYPKCIWDGTWEKIWDAGKGHQINPLGGTAANPTTPDASGNPTRIVTPLPAQAYDVISELTDGIPKQDKLSYNIKIEAVEIGGTLYPILGNGITVAFSEGGVIVNGDIQVTDAATGTVYKDVIAGQIDFNAGIVNIAAVMGVVTGVVLTGYLSNELNLRTVYPAEVRDFVNWTIEDGHRWCMPFSIEEITDHAALLDLNFYNRMVDAIVVGQGLLEDQTIIKFYEDEFDKYLDVNSDIFRLESVCISNATDIRPYPGYAGDPWTYYGKQVQRALHALIAELTDLVKLDNLSFIIVGNPKATDVISPFVEWKYQSGTNIGGIRMNNSYGFMTDYNAPVRVVATNKYDAYTKDLDPVTNARELVLRIFAFPTDPEHISFRHLKYTSHLMTSQSQTAYQSLNAPGGAYTVVTATSRYKTIALQGIQARLVMRNSTEIYPAGPRYMGFNITPAPVTP